LALDIEENMMKNNLKILTVASLVSLSLGVSATTETLTGTFTTIKDVSIIENQQLLLTGLNLANTSACDLEASTDGTGTDYVGDAAMAIGSANANAPGAAIATMGGVGCLASTTGGQFGLYEIDGAAGATVTVTVTDGASTDVSINPAGCVANYVAGVDGDSCTIVEDGTPAVVRLAGATDTGSLGEGTPVVGKSIIALGATAIALVDLTAETDYDVDFTIDVTY
jgi:hypothetical protein